MIGKSNRGRPKDLHGKKFGRLTVLSENGSIREKTGTTKLWLCRCDCGKEVSVRAGNLLQGRSLSCGCLRTERVVAANTTHGMSSTRIYKVWASMVMRCTNPRNKVFNHYGGRGVTVCDDWLTFDNFHRDMGDRPKGGTLERVDNNKGYSKDNCVWASWGAQRINKRHSHISKAYELTSPDGDAIIIAPEMLSKFCRENGLTHSNLSKVFSGGRYNGWSGERFYVVGLSEN
jgi:hypothetical protein